MLLLDINLQNKVNFKDVNFVDGMGNDVYMGHLPGSREIHKMFIQNIFNKMNIHKLFSINMINKFGKFGDLFRPNFMANFPGSNIKLNSYFDLVSYFEKYSDVNNIVMQRALQRGIHYDFGSAINKSILYTKRM